MFLSSVLINELTTRVYQIFDVNLKLWELFQDPKKVNFSPELGKTKNKNSHVK